LGERFNGIEEVVGSNPISSTFDFGFVISDLARPNLKSKIINHKWHRAGVVGHLHSESGKKRCKPGVKQVDDLSARLKAIKENASRPNSPVIACFKAARFSILEQVDAATANTRNARKVVVAGSARYARQSEAIR
jgi:hypothetical protein